MGGICEFFNRLSTGEEQIQRHAMKTRAKKAAKANIPSVTKGYFQLVEEFPLVTIHNEEHLLAAEAVIDRLLRLDLDEGEEAYLDMLGELVAVYEDEHVIFPDATEAGVLRELMDSNQLTQSQLSLEVGISQSTISAILTGARSLTKAQVMKLAKRFNVPAEVFLPR
jgi:HTH-type transcriptional regulator/antitoxin HigA